MKVEYAGYAEACPGAYQRKKRVLLASLPQSSIGQKGIAGLKN